MADKPESFSDRIKEIEQRKLRSRQNPKRSVWLGLGTMGMVGWSVALPLLLGTALGWWLDKTYPQHFSWTLTFMIGGLMLGCVIAYQWLNEENKDINKENTHQND